MMKFGTWTWKVNRDDAILTRLLDYTISLSNLNSVHMRRALQNIYQVAHDILLKPECAWKLATLIVLGDAVLSQLIIRFISCALFPPLFPLDRP